MTLVLNLEDLSAPSKTGLTDFSSALDLEAHNWLASALLSLINKRQADDRLFQCSYAELLASMHQAAGALGCQAVRPTPHGLRHGGASHDRAYGLRSLAEIQSRGKWRSPLSVQRYEKHARIAEQLERLPPHVLRDLRSRAARLPAASRASYALF